ncbi:MAG TPA: TIGR03118 family protein [Thermoanaerobaculia bacterium]|nr:TIGR03118 family protein [Thermoanaerobaculia bacterium]
MTPPRARGRYPFFARSRRKPNARATTFGRFSGGLIVGNFGDGRINAYCKDDEGEWHHGGALREGKHPVVIGGLWGIGFGNDHSSGPSTTLYFAAGPDEETNGYFGKVEAVQ